MCPDFFFHNEEIAPAVEGHPSFQVDVGSCHPFNLLLYEKNTDIGARGRDPKKTVWLAREAAVIRDNKVPFGSSGGKAVWIY